MLEEDGEDNVTYAELREAAVDLLGEVRDGHLEQLRIVRCVRVRIIQTQNTAAATVSDTAVIAPAVGTEGKRFRFIRIQ